jgi:hypothetical protein
VVDLVDSGDMGEQVKVKALKQLRSGQVIKKKVVFEKGSNAS